MPINTALLDQSIKVATLNIMHPPVGYEGRHDAFIEQAKKLDADILMLQEVVFEGTTRNSPQLNRIARELGMNIHATVVSKTYNDGEYGDGVAILSKFVAIETGVTTSPAHSNPSSVWAHLVAPNGRSVIVFTMHGSFGGENANRRSDQMFELEIQAKHQAKIHQATDPIIILGGDLNATPEEDCLRYLTGKSSWRQTGALWVDSFAYAGTGDGHTTDPENLLGQGIARFVGIKHPEANPLRRIDYILVRGWVYGRPGMPLKSELCFTETNEDGYTPSDHYGVVSDLWCPPLS